MCTLFKFTSRIFLFVFARAGLIPMQSTFAHFHAVFTMSHTHACQPMLYMLQGIDAYA